MTETRSYQQTRPISDAELDSIAGDHTRRADITVTCADGSTVVFYGVRDEPDGEGGARWLEHYPAIGQGGVLQIVADSTCYWAAGRSTYNRETHQHEDVISEHTSTIVRVFSPAHWHEVEAHRGYRSWRDADSGHIKFDGSDRWQRTK